MVILAKMSGKIPMASDEAELVEHFR